MDFKVLVSPDNLINILKLVLQKFITKDYTYSKSESVSLFSSKTYEHTHGNMTCLDNISGDDTNIYYKGTKILTSALKPYTYQVPWVTQTYNTQTLLLDVNNIFVTKLYTAIIASEITVVNNILSTDPIQDVKIENQLHLIVTDNSITILDVLIPPGSTQKYELGISPNIKVYISGQFSGNYYMTAY